MRASLSKASSLTPIGCDSCDGCFFDLPGPVGRTLSGRCGCTVPREEDQTLRQFRSESTEANSALKAPPRRMGPATRQDGGPDRRR